MQDALNTGILALVLLIAAALGLAGLAAVIRAAALAASNFAHAGVRFLEKGILVLLVVSAIAGPSIASLLTLRMVRGCPGHSVPLQLRDAPVLLLPPLTPMSSQGWTTPLHAAEIQLKAERKRP